MAAAAFQGGSFPRIGMQRALDYAVTLDIPFVFSSNGDGFVFHDRTGNSAEKEATLALNAFPPPGQQWARYCAWKGLNSTQEELVLQDYFDDGSGKVQGKTASRHTSADFIGFLTDIVESPRNPKRFTSFWITFRRIKLRQLRIFST